MFFLKNKVLPQRGIELAGRPGALVVTLEYC